MEVKPRTESETDTMWIYYSVKKKIKRSRNGGIDSMEKAGQKEYKACN